MQKENERILARVSEITKKNYTPNNYGLQVAIEDLLELLRKLNEGK